LKIFLPLVLLDQMNARSDFARIQSLFHRCQVQRVQHESPVMRNVLALISARIGKIGKPVCYNVCVGGNSAAALFDTVRT